LHLLIAVFYIIGLLAWRALQKIKQGSRLEQIKNRLMDKSAVFLSVWILQCVPSWPEVIIPQFDGEMKGGVFVCPMGLA